MLHGRPCRTSRRVVDLVRAATFDREGIHVHVEHNKRDRFVDPRGRYSNQLTALRRLLVTLG
jgi:hypothetical protein